jgi:hypothetical protein
MATEAQILNILVALHLSRVFYKSTLFMQNKPNLLNAQMNANKVLTKDYENVHLHRGFKKQTQSNPIPQKSPFFHNSGYPQSLIYLACGWIPVIQIEDF